ncbi:ribonuclease T2 family protein [Sphingobium lignivorans]|uniref:Ribonuclease T2 n=1 Tax=Sphingobium lignivorans TaxID=2735886 RepID=A0ABR6NEM5_9SPHN|nr:ribonuclease T [Sphingobium lignivorans]MBB5985721.1 ribonuclease T2 [Sphingobium lignivorans]
MTGRVQAGVRGLAFVLPALGALHLASAPAQAQLAACALPEQIEAPRQDIREQAKPRIMPIGGYLLALSWSPQHCAEARDSTSFQCAGKDNRFGFVLHGLWPQGTGRDWPQYCRPAERLSTPVLRASLCATPSVDLLQHEWARHGTCMARTPEPYFAAARRHYARVRFPDMARLAADGTLTVARFTQAFMAANRARLPALDARAIRVRMTQDGWLDELWLCMDRQQRFAACRPDWNKGAAPGRRLRIRQR